VGRVVFASSTHATGYTPPPPDTDISESGYPCPDTNYGVGKAAGEAIGSLYADRYGMGVACVRIGACFGNPGSTLGSRHNDFRQPVPALLSR
jgi:nucleoside-diphosphate-sugar epimerase